MRERFKSLSAIFPIILQEKDAFWGSSALQQASALRNRPLDV
jgi:hypothetical protein